MRGPQPASSKIVLVYFDQDDWSGWHGPNNNLIRSLKEFSVISDSYFWRPQTWNLFLAKILQQNPRTVGVTFYFSPQLGKPDEGFRSLFLHRAYDAARAKKLPEVERPDCDISQFAFLAVHNKYKDILCIKQHHC